MMGIGHQSELKGTMEQKTTDKQQEIVFPKLNGKKQMAFELKFDGETYQNISQKTGYSESWIKKCFAREGKWYDHYEHWEAGRIADIEKEGRARIKKRIAEALTVQETMLTLIRTNPKEAARAARDLLDRAGLKAPEKIEVSDPEDHAERITEWFENRKQNNDNKDE